MSLSRGQLETLWLRAGGSRQTARTAAAVALAESGGNVGSAGDVGLGGKGPTSFGLWQVHTPAHPQYDAHRLASDPLYAARAAVAISEGGKSFAPWTTYKTGAYRPFLGSGRGSTALPASGGAEAPQTASGGDQATLTRIGELESELRGRTVPVQSPQIPLPKLLQGVAIAQGVAPQRPDTALLSAVQQLRAGLGGEGSAPQGAPHGEGASGRATGSNPAGLASFEGSQVAGWIAPVLSYAREHGWKGKVTSGYRSRAEQERIYNSGVRPAARPGTSNHEQSNFPGGAVDASEAQQLASIIGRSPYRGKLVWAGAKDPVHFSHPHNGSY